MTDDFDEEPHIDLTPLIDVIFMLVVFFVMTMSFASPVLDVTLPKSTSAKAGERAPTLTLAVTAEGTMVLDGVPVSKSELPARLTEKPEALLTLSLDEKTPFEVFVMLVDLAKEKRGGKFVVQTKAATTTTGAATSSDGQ